MCYNVVSKLFLRYVFKRAYRSHTSLQKIRRKESAIKHLVTTTRNGNPVYVNLVGSEVAAQIARTPRLLILIKEAVESVSVRGPAPVIERDMGRMIGHSYVVETTSRDTVFYARRLRETTYTRFVKSKDPSTAQHLTVMLTRDSDGSYLIQRTWIGRLHPALPGDSNEAANSKSYWETHAYISDGEPVQSSSITKDCPY